MVCAQPAKQRKAKRPAVKQHIRWLRLSASSQEPPAPAPEQLQHDAAGQRGDLLAEEEPARAAAEEVLKESVQTAAAAPPLLLPDSRRIDIDPVALEDAMATILVSLHGGLGDAGLALREEARH